MDTAAAKTPKAETLRDVATEIQETLSTCFGTASSMRAAIEGEKPNVPSADPPVRGAEGLRGILLSFRDRANHLAKELSSIRDML